LGRSLGRLGVNRMARSLGARFLEERFILRIYDLIEERAVLRIVPKSPLPQNLSRLRRIANYTKMSRRHVFTHGHAANSPPIPGKSRFRPTEGGQKFTDEVINHPNVRVTYQSNGRALYEVDDLGRVVGRDTSGKLSRGGSVVVEGQNPAAWSIYSANEVVTQFPR